MSKLITAKRVVLFGVIAMVAVVGISVGVALGVAGTMYAMLSSGRTHILGSGASSAPEAPVMIRQFGDYNSPDGRLRLEVFREGKALVNFRLSRNHDGKVLKVDDIGTDAMRWCMYWENTQTLWVYASDFGYFKKYTFQADGTLAEVEVDKTMTLPPSIIHFLPTTLKKDWGIPL